MKFCSSHKAIFIILLCACCVDPFNTSLPGNKTVVVDGLITDQSGPQTVSLSYSSNVGVGKFTRELISGAVVIIIDGGGTQTQMNEVAAGFYQTDSTYSAQKGKNYFIRIKLNNQIYESDIETLLPVGQLDSLFFKLNTTYPVNQFEVYANSSKSAMSTGLMRWRSSFIYQIYTQPSLHTDENGRISPLPCSGASTIPATACTCCTCWVSGQNTGVIISDESNFNNNKFNNNLVANIPIGDQQFEFKYYLRVDLLSLSTVAYDFWNLVRSEQTGATSLFQPASVRVRGNVHSMTNPNEQVLGLFQVSSVFSKSIFINRNDIPVNLQPITPFVTDDCRAQGTNVRPPFW